MTNLKTYKKKLRLDNQKGIHKVIFKIPEMNSLEDLMNFDREYFEKNLESETFIRPFTTYDIEDCPDYDKMKNRIKWVLVRQLMKGIRVRSYIEDVDLKQLN